MRSQRHAPRLRAAPRVRGSMRHEVASKLDQSVRCTACPSYHSAAFLHTHELRLPPVVRASSGKGQGALLSATSQNSFRPLAAGLSFLRATSRVLVVYNRCRKAACIPFSAFWLRSSVVSVLCSLTTTTGALPPMIVN